MKFIHSLLKPWVRNFSPDKKLYNSFNQSFGFYPDNIALYKLAFKHKSSLNESNRNGANNERLEYLGDAILSAIIAHFLFRKFPFKDEGFLTEMRSKIVSRANLNKLAIKLGFEKFIHTNLSKTSKSIYGNTFEAFIGAIYIDKGYDFTKDFILNKIIKYHVDIDELEEKEINFKGKLIDWAQKEKKEIAFKLIKETGRGYDKKYFIQIIVDKQYFGKGVYFSKKIAEQRAAEKTCEMLVIIDEN